MWAHYADRHKGLCYCFEVSTLDPRKINYVDCFRDIDPELTVNETAIGDEAEYASRTKHSAWAYEREVRVYSTLTPFQTAQRRWFLEGEKIKKPPLVFTRFSSQLRLVEVIIGAQSDISAECVKAAIGDLSGVNIFMAQPNFSSCDMVRYDVS